MRSGLDLSRYSFDDPARNATLYDIITLDQKRKNKITAGASLAAIGIILTTLGITYSPDEAAFLDFTGPGLVFAGLTSAIISVPFFVAGGKFNRKKTASIREAQLLFTP